MGHASARVTFAWRGLYTLLVALLVPFALLRLLWRSRTAPAYRQGWRDRLALPPTSPKPVDVWLHAVSVGEVQASLPVLRHLLGLGLRVLVTTTTPTGAARLRELLGEAVQHRYTPFDLPMIQRRFLARLSPRLVLVMETEIWPNMLAACVERGVPCVLINARLSARSAKGYAKVAALSRESIRRYDADRRSNRGGRRAFRRSRCGCGAHRDHRQSEVRCSAAGESARPSGGPAARLGC
jgi:3-deoxy-D-manno-octulosonic-acid transferase